MLRDRGICIGCLGRQAVLGIGGGRPKLTLSLGWRWFDIKLPVLRRELVRVATLATAPPHLVRLSVS